MEITGGEPLLQKNTLELLDRLIRKNYSVLLETNGTVSLKNINPSVIKIMDIKCPSSGVSVKTDWNNLSFLFSSDQLKFVISNKNDFDWAVNEIRERKLDKLCPILFSPNYNQIKNEDLAEWILLGNINVRFQLQLHKYIWSDNRQGR